MTTRQWYLLPVRICGAVLFLYFAQMYLRVENFCKEARISFHSFPPPLAHQKSSSPWTWGCLVFSRVVVVLNKRVSSVFVILLISACLLHKDRTSPSVSLVRVDFIVWQRVCKSCRVTIVRPLLCGYRTITVSVENPAGVLLWACCCVVVGP